MASSDDDEELKRAIAMSLQDADPTKSEVIDLVSDEDEDHDEDLKRAIALSLQEGQIASHIASGESNGHLRQGVSRLVKHNTETDAEKVVSSTKANATSPSSPIVTQTTEPISETPSSPKSQQKAPNSLTGIPGLDRKTMEQERLARLGKRKRAASPERPSKQKLVAFSDKKNAQGSNQRTSTVKQGLQYPTGTIKRTFGIRRPRHNDITVEEVLEAPNVNIAVISSFQLEDSWFFEKLSPEVTKQVWSMNAKGDDLRQELLRQIKECQIPNFKMHFPPLPSYTNSMHSKFMLLFGEQKLRFVVPTANMTKTDWGEVGNDWQPAVFENSVFLIDLPRRDDEQIGKTEDLTLFGQELVYFLEKQETPANVVEGVLKFDFSQTKDLAFIHSIAGYHTRTSKHPTGLHGLASAVRNLELGKIKTLEIDYTASSLGALSDSFLEKLYMAARGEGPGTVTVYPSIPTSQLLEDIRIYYPSDNMVRNSTGGPDCGGIITLERKYYSAPKFPKQCLRDYKSVRSGLLSHNKLMFARGRSEDGRAFAWVYLGSANVSEAAWGNPGKGGKSKDGKWLCRNWECGVLVAVPEERLVGLELGEGEVPPMSVFEGTADVPFEYPGEAYASHGQQPWFHRG